jgi:plasmid stabilization system protein ParE
MAKLIWTEPALRQLEEIVDYIALDKPQAAQKVAATIFSTTDNIERFKFLGRLIPEFPVENYRQLWIKPCWIYYRIVQSDIYILHVRRAETPFRIEYMNEE